MDRMRFVLTSGAACLVILGLAIEGDAQTSAIEQVVLSRDIGTNMGPPSINASGAIAFNDGVGRIQTNAEDSGKGTLRPVVGPGDVPPGILGPFVFVAEPSLNDDGSLAFRGFATDISKRGIYLYLPTGGIKLVADASTRRPGTDETFVDQGSTAYGPGVPVASDAAHTLFSHGTVSTRGVYEAVYDASADTIMLLELVAFGSAFIESPGFSIPLDYAINQAGLAAMTLRRPDLTRGIYAAGPGEPFRVIVQTGDPVPGGGTFSSGLGSGSVNAAGDIVFTAILESGAGLFVTDANGVVRRVIDTGAEVPDHNGVTFSSFGDAWISDSGDVTFRGRYTVDGVTFDGIYRTSDTGLDVVFDQFDGIVVDGELVSLIVDDGFGGHRVLDLSLAPRFVNSSSDVGFLQELPGGDPGKPGPSGIFVAHRVQP
jgi:hypothetical protein